MTDKLEEEMLEWDTFFQEQNEIGNILRKCSKSSEQARQCGNQLYTKKNHNQNIHKDILLQYTKSIAFAPKDSEELAFGFSNRSVLFMHLRYYEKCMIDINTALKITKSEQLKTKLLSRKEKCMSLMDNFNMKNLNEELHKDKLNISTNMVLSTKLQSAAESVDLSYNESYGRHLIANRDIKPGEIVIAEKGYACYPEYHQIYLICSHCLTFAWNGVPCDFCVFTVYCSETCKSDAWHEYHSIECPLLKFLHLDKSIYAIDVILATRIFIKAVKVEGFNNVMKEAQFDHQNDNGISRLLSDGILESNKFRSCYNLHCRSPDERRNVKDRFYESMITFLLIKHTNIINFKSEEHVNVLLTQMINIFMKLRAILDTNGFYYQWCKCTCKNISECQEKCETIRGLFIAPCSSLINHSCMPNVSRFFMPQRKIVLYACRPIKKGEQLCCSYGPTVTMDKISRQNYIQQNFHFTCICPACKENKTLKSDFRKDTDIGAVLKILSEFAKVHEVGAKSPFFKDLSDKWTVFSKELLEQALTISELTCSHFEKYAAFAHFIPYMIYISQAFNHLYGEKSVMPDHC